MRSTGPVPRSMPSCVSRRPSTRWSSCSPGGAGSWPPAASSVLPRAITSRLASDVGLRMNEARMLDLDDVRWELGRCGKLTVCHGKGSRRKGPKPRLVPLINGADRTPALVHRRRVGQFDLDHIRPGAPLFPSERKNAYGFSAQATAEVFRRSLAEAAAAHLPSWTGMLTPHVLRHYCASQLYRAGMSLFAFQELLGHSWTGTTARYMQGGDLVKDEQADDGSSGAKRRRRIDDRGTARHAGGSDRHPRVGPPAR
jgi:integrase